MVTILEVLTVLSVSAILVFGALGIAKWFASSGE